MKLVVVTPTIRPECLEQFKKKWDILFKLHEVQLVVVWDSDDPIIEIENQKYNSSKYLYEDYDLVPHYTDSCRNAGFLFIARNKIPFDYLITLDDDVSPIPQTDPLQQHIDVLYKKVSTSWMNTTHGLDMDYMRGFPYAARCDSTVHCSHGCWIKTPDYDGITQHMRIPNALSEPEKYGNPNFYVGPVPNGIYMPFCGMNIAVTREALPYLYYAPMGKDTGYHRFGDIFLGINLMQQFWGKKWAVYTGASKVIHERASNVYKNISCEVAGLEQNEIYYKTSDSNMPPYFADYTKKRIRFQNRMTELLNL